MVLAKDRLPKNSRDKLVLAKDRLPKNSRNIWCLKKDHLPKISRSSYDEYTNLDKTGTKIFSTDVRRLTLAAMLQSLITLEAASENHLVIGIIQKDKDYDILDRC